MPVREFSDVSVEDCQQIARTPLAELSEQQRRILESGQFLGLISNELRHINPPNIELLREIGKISTAAISRLEGPVRASGKMRGDLIFYAIVQDNVLSQLEKAGV